jgi:phosphatidylglycerol:prolipoprotein diacylglycerol transferase
MRPVLFTWRGRPVSAYAGMLYLGLVFGLAVGNVAANANGMDAASVYLATVMLLVPALIGARLAYAIGHRSEFLRDPGLLMRRSAGGQVMLGGLAAVPVSVPLLAALGVPFWAFWDVATFTMLAGMVFARAGCLLTGCCAGRPTEGRLGLILPDHRGVRLRRVPTQPLEAAVAVALLAMATGLNAAHLVAGSVFILTLGAYGLARLALQGFRESQPRLGGLSVHRLVSASLVALALSSVSLRGL